MQAKQSLVGAGLLGMKLAPQGTADKVVHVYGTQSEISIDACPGGCISSGSSAGGFGGFEQSV